MKNPAGVGDASGGANGGIFAITRISVQSGTDPGHSQLPQYENDISSKLYSDVWKDRNVWK